MSAAVMGGLVLLAVVLVLWGVGLLLKRWVDRRGLASAGRLGDRMMSGRARAHVAMLSRTLLVRAEAASVASVIAPGVDGDRFVASQPRDGEAAVWVTVLPPAAGKTRCGVRPASQPGWSEVGVFEYAWWSRFPQGSRPARGFLDAAAAALAAAGCPVVERQREFTPGLPGPTSDGVRRALPLDPPSPVGGPFPAVDP